MQELEQAFSDARSAYEAIESSCLPMDPERLSAASHRLTGVLGALEAALDKHLGSSAPGTMPPRLRDRLQELHRHNARVAVTLALWQRHTTASLELLGVQEPALYGADGTRHVRVLNRSRARG